MKKTALLFTSLFLLTMLVFSQAPPVPVDQQVRIGKLENGLTYYIRKNGYPENRVQLRLVVNAGAMQEDSDQLGLAHFIEHMAFNGSRNFQKNELVDFLQSVGVKFGADLNAYTSFDETVYILPLPTEDPAVLDKGLTVLEDWASGVAFSEEEIDKERGVVIEEWRLGQGAQQRMRDQYFPILFQGSRYADRLPIGKKEIIENASYQTIRRFYKDWYRPDLMAVIAVGDIDVDAMEKEIRDRFSKLTMPADPREKVPSLVPDHDETLIAITKDPENSFTAVQLIYKQDKAATNDLMDFRTYYLRTMYNIMLSNRLSELTQQADPPFIFGRSSYGGFVRAKDNYGSFAVVGENGLANGLTALVVENERVKKHGFTSGELGRAILDFTNQLDQAAREIDKTESEQYVSEYVNHFLDGEPTPGIEFERAFFNQVAPTFQLEELNQLAKNWITDKNRVVIITGLDKEGVSLPTEEMVLRILDQIDTDSLEPYVDEMSEAVLIDQLPTAGKIKEIRAVKEVGVTKLTLSNGVTIHVKQTDFKNDEIVMNAYSPGGHSLYADEDYPSASNASSIINQSGVKDFSIIDLQKLLAGKTVSVSPYISELREGFNGSAAPRDFEIMLQLIHLYFTQPRKDQTAFQSVMSRNMMLYQNLMANPQYYYSDQVSRIMSQNHPRGGGFPTPEDLEKVNFDRLFDIYKDRFANAGDFTFFFVGNINLEEATPLFEKYLGSLPNTGRTETWRDLGIRPPAGTVDEKLYKGTDPKSFVTISFEGEGELNKKERYLLSSLSDVVSNRLIDILREDESGVYTVRASGSSTTKPYPNYSFTVRFPCGPDNVDRLVKATFDLLADIQKNGVADKDITKVKEGQLKDREENLRQNRYWANMLNSYSFNGTDPATFFAYEQQIKELNSKDLKAIAKKYLDLNAYIKVVMYPEAGE